MNIEANDKFIYFDDVCIPKDNIKNIEYCKLNILLLPFLYFLKREGGLLMEITYFDIEDVYTKYTLRVSKRVYKKILELL